MSKNWEPEVPEKPISQEKYEQANVHQGIFMYHILDEWAKDKVTACKKQAQAMTPIIAISALAALVIVLLTRKRN